MVVYDDKEGWQNKQFLGRGEFTLNFGDFNLEITAPVSYTHLTLPTIYSV